MSAREKYAALVEASLAAAREARARPIARIEPERRLRVVVDLSEVEAAQLRKLAEHLGRSPGELVNETVRHLLVQVPSDAGQP